MAKALKVILAGFILLHGSQQCALSQNSAVLFEKVTGANGEELGKITAVTQDLQGYMWFAGQGQGCLYRFDGLSLRIFRHDKLDNNTLGGNNLETVYADDKGIIWIGFNEDGLDRFDPTTSTFTHYRHQPHDPKSLASPYVTVILQDRRGRLWIGTTNGLDRLDETSGEFVHYQHKHGDSKSLSDNMVRAIYEDSQGTIWVGTGFPFSKDDQESGGLNRLENDGTFTRFMHDPQDEHSLIDNKVRAIFEDSRGVFWIGTSRDGLHTMDRKTGRFERLTYDPADPEKLSHDVASYGFNDQIQFIKEDRHGFIWIGTMLAGISRYDPVTERTTHFENSHGFPDVSGWSLDQSRDGTLWLTTQENNLYRIEFSPKVNDIRLGVRVNRFLEDKNGMFWLATRAGLLLLDHQKKVLQRFNLDSLNPAKPVNVYAMFQNQKDTLWIGTGDGFGVFKIQTGQFSKFFVGPAFTNNAQGAFTDHTQGQIIQDHLGYMWITTSNGLLRLNPRDMSVKWYRVDEKVHGSISSNEITSVLEDKSGNIWAGTNGGLSVLDRKTDQFKNYLGASREVNPFIDHEGTLWVGTNTGLYKSTDNHDAFVPYGEGSVVKSSRIFGIVEDNAKNLWVTTPTAITKINDQQNEMLTYGDKIGIDHVEPGSIYLTSSGEILLGTGVGLNSISPDKFETDMLPFNILFSDILINNSSIVGVQRTGGLGLASSDDDNMFLMLTHDQNNIVFNYASDDYRNPELTRYSTMLEGFENVWRGPTTERTSHYINVPPGKYEYRVKAYNAFGGKAENQITIRITPPWWKTWWAYSFYGLCGIGLLWLGRREIIKRERLRSDLELEHLELTKAKEIDKVKSAFFTNISHEFRTPLTLIKGPAQILQQEFSDFPGVKKQAKLIQQNADVLLKHINQLLDLAKLEAGTVDVNSIKVDLNSFLGVIVESFSSYAKQKEIEFDYKLPDIRCDISIDKDKLETIITNLLSNAIKFTPAHGRVDLDAHVSWSDSSSAGQLVVTISDTGIGISPEEQAKIFERFYQVNEGGAHKEVGTGVGLALVKELTELLGGSVKLNSEPGRGSTFYVTLPVQIINVRSDNENHDQFKAEEINLDVEENDIGGNSNGKTKLLIVEDNAELRSFIISSLRGDYSFYEAGDGKEGIDVALQEIPELIISDVMMPEMDGIAMTAKLKKDIRTSHIPVILLTAKATHEAKITGLNTGADDYLVKPFDNYELLLKVRNMIESRNKVREKMRIEFMREGPTVDVISADEKLLQKVRETILTRLSDEQLSVDSLAEEIGLSRAHFYRKIAALTGLPVNELIQSFRLERAAQLLAQQWGPVSQVAFEVGFSNPSYFSKRFKEKFGVSPSEYPLKDQVH